jgi:rhodanese-related sulfurtransferase
MNSISRNEIRNAIDRGDELALIEALPENFYEAGHIPGALSIPVGQAATLAPMMLPDKNKMVIVYCSGSVCNNSVLVAEELVALGYTNVCRYVEGKEDWKSAGLVLEASMPVPAA